MSGPMPTALLRGIAIGLGVGAVAAVLLAGLDEVVWIALAVGSAGALMAALAVSRRTVAPPSIQDEGTPAWAEFRRELARARRHERPLSIVRLPGGATGRSTAALTVGPHRPLRRVDRAWAEGADLVILMPESDRSAAERAVDRLAPALRIDPTTARVATFPVDGLTSTALVAAVGIGTEGTAPTSLSAASTERIGAATERAAHG